MKDKNSISSVSFEGDRFTWDLISLFFNTSKGLSFSVNPAKHIHTYLLKH